MGYVEANAFGSVCIRVNSSTTKQPCDDDRTMSILQLVINIIFMVEVIIQ